MARKPRIHFSGAVYHVLVRGNNKETIFARDNDKQTYLQKFRALQQLFYFEILIYAIMDNHAHLVIRVFDTPLSKIMHGLQQSYARYYNQTYAHHGHVFEDRYKAYLCDSDRYLLALLSYIHRNPLQAGITPTLKYAWSSHMNYCGMKKDNLVRTDFIYSLMTEGTGADAAKTYREFIEAQDNKQEWTCEQVVNSAAVGDPSKAKEILDVLLDEVSAAHGIDKDSILSKHKNRHFSQARKDLIYRLHHDWQIPSNQIAALIGISKSYISKMLQK